MDIILREATQEDLPAMLGLYRHLSPGDPPVAPADAARHWAALLDTALAHPLVAEAEGLIVASCLLLVVPNLTRGGRPFALIENVVTHADYRRRGCASRVLRHAQAIARAANCYKIMLATGRTDEGVLRFYETVGFRRGGKTFFEMRWTD